MRPTTGVYTEEWYQQLEPLHFDEERLDYPLLAYLEAMGANMEEIINLVRTGPNGEPGWSPIMDIDRTLEKGLPWLGQLVGVHVPDGLTDEQKRDIIRAMLGWRRGSVYAMTKAAGVFLTGNKTVIIRERDTSAYHFRVMTYTSETPEADWPVHNLLSNPSFETNTTGWSTGYE